MSGKNMCSRKVLLIVLLTAAWACSKPANKPANDTGDSPATDTGDQPDGSSGNQDMDDSDVPTTSDATSPDSGGGNEWCPVVGYEACGGDLVGTWAFRSLCPEDPDAAAALCEQPYDDRAVCTGVGNEATCDGTYEGTLTFGADGMVVVEATNTLVANWNFTDACLAEVATGATPEERCASIGNDRLTCTYTDHCNCVGDPIVQEDMNTVAYTIDGMDVTLGDDPPASYCVDGDRLTMDYYVFHPVSWRYWVLERQ